MSVFESSQSSGKNVAFSRSLPKASTEDMYGDLIMKRMEVFESKLKRLEKENMELIRASKAKDNMIEKEREVHKESLQQFKAIENELFSLKSKVEVLQKHSDSSDALHTSALFSRSAFSGKSMDELIQQKVLNEVNKSMDQTYTALLKNHSRNVHNEQSFQRRSSSGNGALNSDVIIMLENEILKLNNDFERMKSRQSFLDNIYIEYREGNSVQNLEFTESCKKAIDANRKECDAVFHSLTNTVNEINSTIAILKHSEIQASCVLQSLEQHAKQTDTILDQFDSKILDIVSAIQEVNGSLGAMQRHSTALEKRLVGIEHGMENVMNNSIKYNVLNDAIVSQNKEIDVLDSYLSELVNTVDGVRAEVAHIRGEYTDNLTQHINTVDQKHSERADEIQRHVTEATSIIQTVSEQHNSTNQELETKMSALTSAVNQMSTTKQAIDAVLQEIDARTRSDLSHSYEHGSALQKMEARLRHVEEVGGVARGRESELEFRLNSVEINAQQTHKLLQQQLQKVSQTSAEKITALSHTINNTLVHYKQDLSALIAVGDETVVNHLTQQTEAQLSQLFSEVQQLTEKGAGELRNDFDHRVTTLRGEILTTAEGIVESAIETSNQHNETHLQEVKSELLHNVDSQIRELSVSVEGRQDEVREWVVQAQDELRANVADQLDDLRLTVQVAEIQIAALTDIQQKQDRERESAEAAASSNMSSQPTQSQQTHSNSSSGSSNPFDVYCEKEVNRRASASESVSGLSAEPQTEEQEEDFDQYMSNTEVSHPTGDGDSDGDDDVSNADPVITLLPSKALIAMQVNSTVADKSDTDTLSEQLTPINNPFADPALIMEIEAHVLSCSDSNSSNTNISSSSIISRNDVSHSLDAGCQTSSPTSPTTTSPLQDKQRSPLLSASASDGDLFREVDADESMRPEQLPAQSVAATTSAATETAEAETPVSPSRLSSPTLLPVSSYSTSTEQKQEPNFVDADSTPPTPASCASSVLSVSMSDIVFLSSSYYEPYGNSNSRIAVNGQQQTGGAETQQPVGIAEVSLQLENETVASDHSADVQVALPSLSRFNQSIDSVNTDIRALSLHISKMHEMEDTEAGDTPAQFAHQSNGVHSDRHRSSSGGGRSGDNRDESEREDAFPLLRQVQEDLQQEESIDSDSGDRSESSGTFDVVFGEEQLVREGGDDDSLLQAERRDHNNDDEDQEGEALFGSVTQDISQFMEYERNKALVGLLSKKKRHRRKFRLSIER